MFVCGNETFYLNPPAQWLAYLPPDPAALGLIPGKNKKFSQEKNVYGAEVNQRRWSEESGQWLKNVGQTHLILDCGKLVLQKHILP